MRKKKETTKSKDINIFFFSANPYPCMNKERNVIKLVIGFVVLSRPPQNGEKDTFYRKMPRTRFVLVKHNPLLD